ncbi:aminoglycoside phosphotransferase family protein [Wenzhouxiangella sediminis]|uniref:Aminoglycoside phosphotransferase n=1 Tax=Wenzhouxiangella sediminis TaxID=1792836 RepID=A0A3E1KA86_9GAMM|nr:phosphotransferase [Wenzhouxiangella sediminis]RFF31223.1 aminoglycoside phosphotransferase [Wenzhouxiangella sediminis]
MSPQDERRRIAETWAAKALGWNDWDSEAISSDASFRRYFRLHRGDDTRVVMDAPPEHEDTGTFVDVAARLASTGVHVPEIQAHDPGQGLVLLEDLGSRPFHHVLDEDNADELFGDAVEALIRFQREADTTGLPDYDPALLMRELALFPDWFLERHWRVEATDGELDAWDLVCATLIRWALDQPQVFCHRDYMPRNLMVADPNPGIIDFQDAVRGPISYDPVCLYRDAFLSWPNERVDAWLEDYRRKAVAAGLPAPEDPDLWRRTCDFMGVHRHLKVIGIFARIRYRDGKPKYLEDAPRFFAYLEQSMARNPELDELDRLLESWRQRRVV